MRFAGHILRAAALCVALLASGCRTAPAAKTHANPPLSFGAVAAQKGEERSEALEPIVKWLEERLDAKITLTIPPSYPEMTRALAEGKFDLAYVGPILYSRAHETGYDAAAVPVRGGSTSMHGQILVRADRGLKTLADLKGKSLAFVDPSSSAGFQYPFALLFANGLKPADYQRTFLHAHHEVVRAVFDGKFDAGAVYEGAADEALTPEERKQVTVLGVTDSIAGDVIAVKHDTPRAAEIRQALLDMGKDCDVLKLLHGMRAQTLAPANEQDYDAARKIDLLVSEESGL